MRTRWASSGAAAVVVAALMICIGPSPVAAAAPPPNDARGAATAIASLPFSGTVDVSGATRESSDPGACYNDILARWARTMYRTVWYRIPTPGADTLIVRVVASAGRPVLVAGRVVNGRLLGDCQYTGRRDATGYMSYIDPTRDAFVVIGLADDVPATLDVEIRSGAVHAATNDAWQDATPIEQTPFVDRVDLAAATGSADDPTACNASEHTIWYRIRPSHRIRLEVSASGVAPSIQIVRRVSGAFVTTRCVSSGSETSDLEWTFSGGVTTYIVVGLEEGAEPGPPGAVTLTIPNDPITPKPPWATSATGPSAPMPATATIGPERPGTPGGPAPFAILVIVLAGSIAAAAATRRERLRR